VSDYINWDKISPRMKVKLVGRVGARHYEAGGKIVLMDGQNQKRIQSYLDSRVRSDAQRFKK